ncbi:MAG TPA: DNRLRE domain-containing protein [Jatrophihabitans sp.]|nr:DNRLRE domain-containing protein [Jatrophihabitans sp.]
MLSALLPALLVAGLLILAGQHHPARAGAAETPIRAAFYYGWFPETEHWASHYTPAAGKYDSSDSAVVANQVRQAKAAGLNAFISSWWGQGSKTDSRLPLLLDTAAAQGFKVAPYYEQEGFGNPTTTQLASDLSYLAAKAAATPAWLRVGGLPVLFVYNADDTTCAVTDRWVSANQGRFYLNMKVMPGYQTCAHQPDSWHQYGPASAIQLVLPWSVNVAPGFFKFDESTPRLARNLSTFKSALAQQVSSGAQWQLVTSWNEWGEGTGVEPTVEMGQSYTDAMAAAYLPASTSTGSATPTSTSTGSATPTATATAPPPASTVGLPAADSYVKSDATGTNYGTAGTVQQNATSSALAVSYLRFAAPAGTVAKATLRLFSRSSGVTPSKVFGTSASWDERTLTWANRPALGGQVATTGTLTAGQWTQADVTTAVRSGVTSFGLTTGATATRYFDSREAANPPQLVLEYSSTSTPPTSTPPTSTPPTSSAPATSSAPTSTAPTPAPTSSAPTSTGVTKLLTVVVENHSLGQVQSGMPYVDGLAKRFAYATNYTAIRHPSLPNYLAMAGGDTFGVTDDAAPSSHPLAGDSVFDQAIANGKTAATYAESMTSNCQLSSSGRYAVKHNPWAYFNGTTQRANCKLFNLPSGTPSSGAMHNAVLAGTLPNAGYWIPDLCDDAHDCSLTTADNYLKSWLPQIMAGPDYTSGRLAIVITADEDDSHSGNVVLTAVIHRSLDGSHKVVTTALNHYSLLRLYDQALGAPLLRRASTASNMATAFGLQVG